MPRPSDDYRVPDGSKALRASEAFFAGEQRPSFKQELAIAGRRKGKQRRQHPRMMLGSVARVLGEIR